MRAGEVFQIQVGQRFVAETDADPLDVYRVLRTLNPSPYMYLLRTGDVDIVGCSPEALVTVTGGRAVLHPIAGTRRRGETAERDAALAAELVADPKEQAEHVMLVDLARNDLGRISAPGSVRGRGVRRASSGTATSGTSCRPSRPSSRRARTRSTC